MKTPKPQLTRIFLASSLMLAGAAAHAQSSDSVNLYGQPTGSGEGRFGGVLVSTTRYMGSEERRTIVLPFVDYRWKNGFFVGLGNGLGYLFPTSSEQIQAGVRITADFGRKEHRSTALRGMGDIDWAPEVGGFFNYFLSRELSVKTSLRYGSGNDNNGLLVDVGVHYGTQIAPQWRLGGSLSTTYANANYMQDYFGVTQAQSVASGYAVSQVGAGIRDVRAGASLTYIINRDWIASGALSVTSFQGDAKKSVIVRENTPVTGLLSISRGF
jgi:outer membrane scaffolding protein for murein synthesis (MipA/OmpV family)